MFFGRYDYTIDPKGRINFPAKFREEIGESFVVMEWADHCLFAVPLSEIENIAESLEGDDEVAAWELTGELFSTATEVTPDKQGRILLQDYQREYAQLTKNVTIVGNRHHVEIWDTDVWNARAAKHTNEQRKNLLKKVRV